MSDERQWGSNAPFPPPEATRRLLHVALCVLLTVLAGWVLHWAESFIVPLVLALFAFVLVNALDELWSSVRIAGRRIPALITTLISTLMIALVVFFVSGIVIDNAQAVIGESQKYERRLDNLIQDTRERIPLFRRTEAEPADEPPKPGDETEPPGGPRFEERADTPLDLDGSTLAEDDTTTEPTPPAPPDRSTLDALLERFLGADQLAPIMTRVANAMLSIVGSATLVLIYLFFLLLERRFFPLKLRVMVPDERKRRVVSAALEKISHDIGLYLGMKTGISMLTALPSYAIMRAVGLDFAEFWALLIFFLNFIPNIGSIIATILPTLLALLQFESLAPFFIIGIGVTLIQLTVANLVEPNLMGRSLNISPLVVILALVAWSLLWGVVGAFLCVPITVVILIVLSHFHSTRWISVLLSRDGRVNEPFGEPGARPSGG